MADDDRGDEPVDQEVIKKLGRLSEDDRDAVHYLIDRLLGIVKPDDDT